jgi:hypothetical protein
MRRNDVLLARENAGHRAQVLAEIGRRLRDEYIAEPLTDRLASLVRQIERSGSEAACAPITVRDPEHPLFDVHAIINGAKPDDFPFVKGQNVEPS